MSDLPPKPPMRSIPRTKFAWYCGLDALQLVGGRAPSEEPRQLLVDGLLDRGEVTSWLGRRLM